MIIADSLRQEPMPEMVFSLCKLALRGYSKPVLMRLMTLGNDNQESREQFNHVYNFAIDCGFIKEPGGSGIVISCFEPGDLCDFRHFRYTVFKSVFHENDNKFTRLAKWYMTLDVGLAEGMTVSPFNVGSITDFKTLLDGKYPIEENYYNGFRFWMQALGLTDYNPSMSAARYFYSAHRILRDWLEFDKPFKTGTRIEAKHFIDKLSEDCPVFENCITKWENGGAEYLVPSLSVALRVLNETEMINMTTASDASGKIFLKPSVYYKDTNSMTHILINEVRS